MVAEKKYLIALKVTRLYEKLTPSITWLPFGPRRNDPRHDGIHPLGDIVHFYISRCVISITLGIFLLFHLRLFISLRWNWDKIRQFFPKHHCRTNSIQRAPHIKINLDNGHACEYLLMPIHITLFKDLLVMFLMKWQVTADQWPTDPGPGGRLE